MQNDWPPRPPGWPGFSLLQPPQDTSLILGRIMERTEHTAEGLSRINGRLDKMDERLGKVEQRLLPPASPPPPIEVWSKALAPAFVWLTALWATGSIERAGKMLAMFAGKGG